MVFTYFPQNNRFHWGTYVGTYYVGIYVPVGRPTYYMSRVYMPLTETRTPRHVHPMATLQTR